MSNEFISGIRLIMADPSKFITFRVIFAAQTFVDNLEGIGLWITGNSDMEQRPRPPGWPTKEDSALRRLLPDAHFLKTDPISKMKQRMGQGAS